MTALQDAPVTRAPNGAVHAFRWKEQRFVFVIASTDTELLSRATAIFKAPAAEAHLEPDLSWHIDDAAGDAALLDVEYECLHFLLRNMPDSPAVHSALLSRDGKGVVIVGPSFAGKSTLATGLWRNGWSLLADDLAFLNPETRTAAPAPRRVSLRTESRPIVGEELWNEIQQTPSFVRTAKGLYFHPHEVTGEPRMRETALSGIFFLARRGVEAEPAQASPLNPAKAALSLLPYAHNFRELPFIDGLARISPLASAIPSWDLGRGDLREMVKTVERHLG